MSSDNKPEQVQHDSVQPTGARLAPKMPAGFDPEVGQLLVQLLQAQVPLPALVRTLTSRLRAAGRARIRETPGYRHLLIFRRLIGVVALFFLLAALSIHLGYPFFTKLIVTTILSGQFVAAILSGIANFRAPDGSGKKSRGTTADESGFLAWLSQAGQGKKVEMEKIARAVEYYFRALDKRAELNEPAHWTRVTYSALTWIFVLTALFCAFCLYKKQESLAIYAFSSATGSTLIGTILFTASRVSKAKPDRDPPMKIK